MIHDYNKAENLLLLIQGNQAKTERDFKALKNQLEFFKKEMLAQKARIEALEARP